MAMEGLRNLADRIAMWVEFNVGSTEMAVLIVLIVVLASASAAVIAVSIARRSAAAELAHYGFGPHRLRSFVCRVCLHRSYAESHIRRRYCARCDKTYPDEPKTWKLQEAGSNEYPASVTRIHYRGLNEPPRPARSSRRA